MQTHMQIFISQLLSLVNMLFLKTGSFTSLFIQKLISSTRSFQWCCFALWLSVTTTSCSDSFANFYGKLDLPLVSILVKSSIDVHQIAWKRSLFWNILTSLTDTCIICYWTVVCWSIFSFQMFFVFDIILQFTITWPFIIVICTPQSNKS